MTAKLKRWAWVCSSLALGMVGGAGLGHAQDAVSGQTTSPNQNLEADTTTLGAHIGLVDTAPLNGLALGYGLGANFVGSPNLLEGVDLDYFSQSIGSVSGPHLVYSDLALGLNIKYVFTNVNTTFRPYALGGLAGHHFAVTNVDYSNQSVQGITDNANKVGIDLGGGIMYRVMPNMNLSAEARWRQVTGTIANLNQLAITGAAAYLM